MTDSEYPYEPEERFDALGALLEYNCSEGANSKHSVDKVFKYAKDKTGMTLTEQVAPNEISWDPVTRFNALAKTFEHSRGCKSVEHMDKLRQSDPAVGSLAPAQERVALTEYPYSPQARFHAIAKLNRAPRGAKSSEHLANLRQSDPTFGSLAPAQERVGIHELPYDPVRRYALMARAAKQPRGAKSFEHLANLRQSDPTFGSLAPAQERVALHELPYDPVRRFVALSKLIEVPRGAKSLDHLQNLRVNDPMYGSLAPRRLGDACNAHAIGWVEVHHEDAKEESESSEEWRRPSSGRLPRILSNQMMHFSDEDDDSELWTPSPREPRAKGWTPPSPKRNPNYFPAHAAFGMRKLEDVRDEFPDDASMRSDARTSLGLRTSERASNDTICSFLDDHDVNSSGEFSAFCLDKFASQSPSHASGSKGKVHADTSKDGKKLGQNIQRSHVTHSSE